MNINDHVFIHRPDASFSGKVIATRDGWVRVAGKGDNNTLFDEWFRVEANKTRVTKQKP